MATLARLPAHRICPKDKDTSKAKFINPFTDWGFKHIFGREISKELLICFLNDLFAGEFHIADLKFNNNEHHGLTKDGRGVVFDIFCTTDEGRNIIVEMQNRAQEHFIDRALYYTSRAIVEQGKKGDWDYGLTPVYTVCFMNFVDSGLPAGRFRTDIVLADRDTGRAMSDKVRMVYLMLPLFTKEEGDCENDFERWIFVLKNMSTLERMPFLAQNAVFRRLAEISDLTALSKEEQEKYDESIRIMRDTYATMSYARKEGHAEGLAEGMEKGKKQGLEEGKKQGLEEGKKQGLEEGKKQGLEEGKKQGLEEGRIQLLSVARNLLRSGMDVEEVCRLTGLPREEIERLE